MFIYSSKHHIRGIIVSYSTRVRHIMGSSPGRVKPRTKHSYVSVNFKSSSNIGLRPRSGQS